MASLVNPFNINGNYPVAGQDNDSQGFRDNFTNIKNNFFFIKQEVEDLQTKAILKSALSGGSLDNNFLGSQVKNIQVKNISETVYDWGEVGTTTATEIQLDLALGNVHKLNAVGSIKINSVIKNWPSSLQFSRLLFYVNIDTPDHTLELPSTLTTELYALPGFREISSSKLITFTDPGYYIFEFSSVDSGTTIFVRELTKGNPVFRDPNFYMAGIGEYGIPSLRLGWGNLFGISSKIDSDTKGNADVFSVRGAITSFMNLTDGGNDPANMTQAGFSVAKSRTVDPGASGTLVETVVNNNDYIGYFNGLAYTKNKNDSQNSYQSVASIGMYASGANTSYGLGGNIVISTKRDGGVLSPAIAIDNTQNVTIFGGLDVQGTVTYIESTNVVIKDKQLILANGSINTDAADSAGVSIEVGVGTWANLAFYGPTTTNSVAGRFDFNYPVNVSATTTSTNSNTGALIVRGGVGIAENLYVGGVFGLTSTAEATSTITAAFAVGGGIATAKNLITGGNIFANATTTAIDTVTGALQVQGGGFLKGNLIIGGDSSSGSRLAGHGGAYVLSTTQSTSVTTGALQVAGGAGIQGNVYLSSGSTANGVTISSTLASVPAMFGSNTTARSATAALRVKGGTALEGNVVIGFNNSGTSGRLFIDNGKNPSVFANGVINLTSGGMVLGNGTSLVGATITGDVFIGTDNSGSIYTVNKEKALGGPVDGTLKPYETELTGGQPTLGAITALGGANIFGDVYIGQPHDGTDYANDTGTWTGSLSPLGVPEGAWSGNLNLNSGARATSFNSGAMVVANVKLADGTYSQGGIGVSGNLYVNQNAVLGSIATNTGNVIAVATTSSTTTTTGALVAIGGVGIGENLNVGGVTKSIGNIIVTSTTEASSTTAASIITLGGIYAAKKAYIAGNIFTASTLESTSLTTGSFVSLGGMGLAKRLNVGGNVVVSSGTASTTTTTGAIVVSGAGGVGVGGSVIAGGNIVAASGTASTSTTTGALVVSGAGGVGVGGAINAGGIYASGASSGIGFLSGSGGAQTQGSSKATTVVSNTPTGQITMFNTALAANTSTSFTLTCSSIAASDLVLVEHQSVGALGAYNITATPAAGSAVITVRNNSTASLSEAIVLRYLVLKSVNA